MKWVFAILLLGAAVEDPLEKAREAFVKGEYDKAIFLAEKHRESAPEPAWRLIGACHCFRKDAARARDAYVKLDESGKKFLRYVCWRNRITL